MAARFVTVDRNARCCAPESARLGAGGPLGLATPPPRAVSYGRAGEQLRQVGLEIKQFLAPSRGGRQHAAAGRPDH